MLLPVLRLLSHHEFISGEAISRRLGISRASVHNLVERAKKLGVRIHAVRGQGYRLAEFYSWLDQARLSREAVIYGHQIQLHDHIESTNTHLMALAQQGMRHKTIVVAEIQTGGRGRRGREWLSLPGGGLTFSLLWRFNRPLTALSGLSLAVGVAVVRGLRGMGVLDAAVKWPNDILAQEGKLAGVLIETQGDMLSAATAVIGVGVNVGAIDAAGDRIGQPVASLADVLGHLPDRNDVLLALLRELDSMLENFDRTGFAPIMEEWQALHAWQGRWVKVQSPARESIEGCVLGVDEAGALLLNTPTGLISVHSGEVSLRLGDDA